MSKYIDCEAFIAEQRHLYCDNCARRKNSKGKFVYDIGDAPCRACDICDVLDAVEDAPAADVRPVVQCDECVWHVDCGYHYCNKWCAPCPDNSDFFCAYGERPSCGADMREES